MEKESLESDSILIDESFFIDRDYKLTVLEFGNQTVHFVSLQSAATDFDLTGQLVWPGAMLLCTFISNNDEMFHNSSVIELGSGVGASGILCSRFCSQIVLTDHNEEVLKVLKQNIELQSSFVLEKSIFGLESEKLEWGNCEHVSRILQKHTEGFDFIIGADICYQQSYIPLLFDTVELLLRAKGPGRCKFFLSYMSRVKMVDMMVVNQGLKHGMHVTEVPQTRSVVGNHEGFILQFTLPPPIS